MMTHTTQRSHEDNPQGPKVSVTRDDPRAATIEEIQPIVDRGDQGYAETPVSYTHLTLPTSDLV